MTGITKSTVREIIVDFANEIKKSKRACNSPEDFVIHFRNEDIENRKRKVWFVPLELLRYRKDNGRITSNVLSYEKDKGFLIEKNSETQNLLEKFLFDKDPELTTILINSLRRSGQEVPAIITIDGFLINGNRRKVALKKLYQETHEDKYNYMKVVMLPDKDEEGGAPTLLEIEQIENRYQLWREGKAEYYHFDRALSIRRKIQIGISLREQLKDDPNYFNLPPKEFEKKVKEYDEEYLKPLECIDEYLQTLDRSERYDTISTSATDRLGRWQAFLDYYQNVQKKLDDENERIKLNIEDDEIGDIKDIAYKIIRKRDFPQRKLHNIMRKFSKLISNPESKKKLIKILDIDMELSEKESKDNGKELDERTKDLVWGAKHNNVLVSSVKEAIQLFDLEKERETPISLLEAALGKLEHDNMKPESINAEDNKKAMQLSEKIMRLAEELKNTFYKHMKRVDKLRGTKSHVS